MKKAVEGLADKAMAEFDSYSSNYRDLVTESVRASGEPSEYFAAYKAKYLRLKLGAAGILSVLDYGCGVGALSEQIKLEMPQARIDGFDPSQESLDRVSSRLQAEGLFRRDLDLLPCSYDLIVIANVLHHVEPGRRLNVIRCAYEKLKPGGRLVVFEHNPFNPLTRWAVSQCPFDEDAILLKSREVYKLLLSTGFHRLQRDFIVFFPRPLAFLRSLEASLTRVPFGAQYACIGTRPV